MPLGIARRPGCSTRPAVTSATAGCTPPPTRSPVSGMLYLRGGVWQGKRLLPASWVAEATRPHVSNADGTAGGAVSDWQQGYGLQFWMSRHGYRGDGAYGQFCVVLPEHDAVIAMTAATEQMQAVLDLAWEHLLPAFGPRAAGRPGATRTRHCGSGCPGSHCRRSRRSRRRLADATVWSARGSPRRAAVRGPAVADRGSARRRRGTAGWCRWPRPGHH